MVFWTHISQTMSLTQMIASHHMVTTTFIPILAQTIPALIHMIIHIIITLSILHLTLTMIATEVVILHGTLSWRSLFIVDKFLQITVIVIVIILTLMIVSLLTFTRTISIKESTTIRFMVTDTNRHTVTYTLRNIMMTTTTQTIITILTIITIQTTTTQMTIITQVTDITQATIMTIITMTRIIMSQRATIMNLLSKRQRNIMNINLGTRNLTSTLKKKAATTRQTF